MFIGLGADLLVLLHFGFILFVVFGALLALRWQRWLWLHLPAVVWAAWIEFSGSICPLTPLENRLRRLAGETGYGGSFIGEYLLPLIYPGDLTRELQVVIGVGVILINLLIYGTLFTLRKR